MPEIIVSMECVSVELLDLDTDKYGISSTLPSPAEQQFTSDTSGEDVISQLTSAFEEALDLESSIDCPLGENAVLDMGVSMTGEKSGAPKLDKNPLNAPASDTVKCLCKSATFPVADSKGEANASESLKNVSCLRSMSLPVQRKVIPAMKGSREKEGLPLKKLSVSWAPDVYDPLPSSVSHLPKKKNNQQYRYNNKKHGKGKKNKGKNTRGSNKKDKKLHKEESSLGQCKLGMDPIVVTDTDKKFAMDDPPAVTGTDKITVALLDFDNGVDSPDSNCGSSFLRESCGTLCYPYAETT